MTRPTRLQDPCIRICARHSRYCRHHHLGLFWLLTTSVLFDMRVRSRVPRRMPSLNIWVCKTAFRRSYHLKYVLSNERSHRYPSHTSGLYRGTSSSPSPFSVQSTPSPPIKSMRSHPLKYSLLQQWVSLPSPGQGHSCHLYSLLKNLEAHLPLNRPFTLSGLLLASVVRLISRSAAIFTLIHPHINCYLAFA
jgi:hypothetical protein